MPEPITYNGVTRPVATKEELLEFANTVRTAGGAEVLEALLPSRPNNAQRCLIANALNFSCAVAPCGGDHDATVERFRDQWEMSFPENMERERIEKIGEAVGCKIIETVGVLSGTTTCTMILPPHIGFAADAFDAGAAFQDLVSYNDREGN